MRRKGVRLTSIALLAFVVTASTTGTAADSQKFQVERLGKHNIGAPLSEVRRYKTAENCLIEREKADCAFIDQDGVEYLVLDEAVITVTASENTTSRTLKLPFELRFGDSIEAAIHKLIVRGRVWLVGSDDAGGVTLSSFDRYAGSGDWEFNIEARFDRGRLVEIKYSSGTV